MLDDEAFYADCRNVLADGGVMSVNLFGRDASFARSQAVIGAVFGAGQVWSLRPTREGNTVRAGRARACVRPTAATLVQRAANIELRYGAFGARRANGCACCVASPAVTETEPT